jgi:hypothetical protein
MMTRLIFNGDLLGMSPLLNLSLRYQSSRSCDSKALRALWPRLASS